MSELSDHDIDETVLESSPVYAFRAQVTNVVDGDTVDCRIDLGFDVYHIQRVRLREIDTRETNFVSHDSEEYKRGMVQKEFVVGWVNDAQAAGGEWPFILWSEEYKRGAYFRIVGDLWSREAKEWLTRELYDEFDDVELYD